MKTNKALEEEMWRKIECGWIVRCEEYLPAGPELAGIRMEREFLVVAQVVDDFLFVVETHFKQIVDSHDTPTIERRSLASVCSARPAADAPCFKFGQSDTVTRAEALRRLKSEGGMILTPSHGWRKAEFRNTELCYNELHYYCMDYTAEKLGHDGWHHQFIEGVTHIKSRGGNVWKVED